jgi:hypothetical protein
VHLAGIAAAGVLMREGTPLVPLASRMAYLGDHAWAWQLGWSIWIGCALSVFAFAWILAARLRVLGVAPAVVALARTLTVLAVMLDVACDLLYAGPFVALAGTGDETAFTGSERLLGIASVTGANGLYTLGVFLFALSFRDGRAPELPRIARLAGVGTVISGSVMAVAGLIGSATLLAVTTGPTIVCFATWSVLVAWRLERS